MVAPPALELGVSPLGGYIGEAESQIKGLDYITCDSRGLGFQQSLTMSFNDDVPSTSSISRHKTSTFLSF